MLHSYNKSEKDVCVYTAELLRHIIWAPPCLLLIYNTYSCYHLALQKPPTISQLTHIGDRYIGGTHRHVCSQLQSTWVAHIHSVRKIFVITYHNRTAVLVILLTFSSSG